MMTRVATPYVAFETGGTAWPPVAQNNWAVRYLANQIVEFGENLLEVPTSDLALEQKIFSKFRDLPSL